MRVNSATWISRAALVPLAMGLFVIAGCTSTTSIKTLLDDPGLYDGKTVHIAGDVTSAVGFLNYGAYKLNDGTGTILVVTKASGAPREGAKVGVEGRFRAAFTLGPVTAAAVQEEKRLSP
jgi:hypothetical protein